MNTKKINLSAKFKTFSAYWNPKIVGKLNQQFVNQQYIDG